MGNVPAAPMSERLKARQTLEMTPVFAARKQSATNHDAGWPSGQKADQRHRGRAQPRLIPVLRFYRAGRPAEAARVVAAIGRVPPSVHGSARTAGPFPEPLAHCTAPAAAYRL